MIHIKISLENFINGSKEYFIINETLNIDKYSINGQDVYFNKNPIIEIEIKKISDILYTRVKAMLDIKLTCTKCLDTFDKEVIKEFTGELANEDDPDRENLILMNDNKIDLVSIVELVLINIVQTNPHCSESCRGLCKICGCNLNHTTCDCEDKIVNINSEFEKLRRMFL